MRSMTPNLFMLSLAFLTLNAQADPLPTRKAGLWEISMTSDRNSDHPMKMKQCTDEETDKKLLQMGSDMQGRATCSKNQTTRTSDGYQIDSVCALSGSTVTSKAVFKGDFTSGYAGDVVTKFEPPLFGQTTSSTKISATWIGPCTGGLNPGDTVLPNGSKMNVDQAVKTAKQAADMLNSPEVAKAMKQMQQTVGSSSPEALKGLLEQLQNK